VDDSGLRVRLDFPGASIGRVEWRGAQLRAELRREALVEADGFRYDYNRHFAFGVSNSSGTDAEVAVRIGCESPENLPGHPPLLWTSASPDRDFLPASLRGRADTYGRYSFLIPVGSGETVYVANWPFRPFDGIRRLFDQLAVDGGAKREIFGRTVDGRDLVGYHFGQGTRPTVLVTSGFHPPEGDTVGSEGVMEYLSRERRSSLRNHFDWYVVPVANPDGYVRGFNGCNANELNFYWQFLENDHDRCPEAYYLWRLVERLTPVLYFDFHAYTFQAHRKFAGPYVKPAALYRDRNVRRLVRAIDADLISLSGGHFTEGALTYAPSTLARKITSRFNTITYAKYHLRMADGTERSKDLAVACVLAAASRLAQHFPESRDILRRPHGRVGADAVAALAGVLIDAWGVRLRPALGRVRRRVPGWP